MRDEETKMVSWAFSVVVAEVTIFVGFQALKKEGELCRGCGWFQLEVELFGSQKVEMILCVSLANRRIAWVYYDLIFLHHLDLAT